MANVNPGALVLFFPVIPGDFQLQDKWYMKQRRRPMVPSPSNTPMPEKATGEKKAMLYSLYMRPWVLDAAIATQHVPFILDLDVVPSGMNETKYMKKN